MTPEEEEEADRLEALAAGKITQAEYEEERRLAAAERGGEAPPTPAETDPDQPRGGLFRADERNGRLPGDTDWRLMRPREAYPEEDSLPDLSEEGTPDTDPGARTRRLHRDWAKQQQELGLFRAAVLGIDRGGAEGVGRRVNAERAANSAEEVAADAKAIQEHPWMYLGTAAGTALAGGPGAAGRAALKYAGYEGARGLAKAAAGALAAGAPAMADEFVSSLIAGPEVVPQNEIPMRVVGAGALGGGLGALGGSAGAIASGTADWLRPEIDAVTRVGGKLGGSVRQWATNLVRGPTAQENLESVGPYLVPKDLAVQARTANPLEQMALEAEPAFTEAQIAQMTPEAQAAIKDALRRGIPAERAAAEQLATGYQGDRLNALPPQDVRQLYRAEARGVRPEELVRSKAENALERARLAQRNAAGLGDIEREAQAAGLTPKQYMEHKAGRTLAERSMNGVAPEDMEILREAEALKVSPEKVIADRVARGLGNWRPPDPEVVALRRQAAASGQDPERMLASNAAEVLQRARMGAQDPEAVALVEEAKRLGLRPEDLVAERVAPKLAPEVGPGVANAMERQRARTEAFAAANQQALPMESTIKTVEQIREAQTHLPGLAGPTDAQIPMANRPFMERILDDLYEPIPVAKVPEGVRAAKVAGDTAYLPRALDYSRMKRVMASADEEFQKTGNKDALRIVAAVKDDLSKFGWEPSLGPMPTGFRETATWQQEPVEGVRAMDALAHQELTAAERARNAVGLQGNPTQVETLDQLQRMLPAYKSGPGRPQDAIIGQAAERAGVAPLLEKMPLVRGVKAPEEIEAGAIADVSKYLSGYRGPAARLRQESPEFAGELDKLQRVREAKTADEILKESQALAKRAVAGDQLALDQVKAEADWLLPEVERARRLKGATLPGQALPEAMGRARAYMAGDTAETLRMRADHPEVARELDLVKDYQTPQQIRESAIADAAAYISGHRASQERLSRDVPGISAMLQQAERLRGAKLPSEIRSEGFRVAGSGLRGDPETMAMLQAEHPELYRQVTALQGVKSADEIAKETGALLRGYGPMDPKTEGVRALDALAAKYPGLQPTLDRIAAIRAIKGSQVGPATTFSGVLRRVGLDMYPTLETVGKTFPGLGAGIGGPVGAEVVKRK